MTSDRTFRVYKALLKTSPLAAKRYLEGASVRETIDRAITQPKEITLT